MCERIIVYQRECNQWEARPLKKTEIHFPATNSFQLWLEPDGPLHVCWQAHCPDLHRSSEGINSCCEFMRATAQSIQKTLFLSGLPWALALIIILSLFLVASWNLDGRKRCPIWDWAHHSYIFSALWLLWFSVLTTVRFSKWPLWQMVRLIFSNIQWTSEFPAYRWFLHVYMKPCEPMSSESQMF